MPKRVRVEQHLSTEKLQERYREAKEPVERSHYQIVWLLSQGKPTREVAEATGYSAEWIREVAKRYNEAGADGLGDGRRKNPGGAARALLTPEQRQELGKALQNPPEDGGLWNSRKVADWIAAKTGREVGVQRGWEHLRGLGYTPQVPRPVHALADPAEQDEFRGNSPSGWRERRRLTRGCRWSCGRWTSTG